MTLVEVLVAVLLLSLLAVGMLYAVRAGLGALDASNRRMLANRRASNAQRILAAQVNGFLPVMARCGWSPMQPGMPPAVAFFQGQPMTMRFVTRYSIQGSSRGLPQIVEIFVIPGEAGQGVRLVVNEIPYRGPVGAGLFCGPAPDPVSGLDVPRFGPPRAGERSFVLADKLAGCRFLYQLRRDNQPPQWVPVWPTKTLWPAAIRIEMAPLEGDQARVPPMTFTGRIRMDRPPGEEYAF